MTDRGHIHLLDEAEADTASTEFKSDATPPQAPLDHGALATSAPNKAPMGNAPSGPQPAGLDRSKRPASARETSVHLIGNTHIDPVWLWTWQEGYQEARATYWSAIHRMEEYEDFVFNCDQIVLLSWVKESDPDLFAEIQRRVNEGRWNNVGGWWVEPDNNMPMGESFARQGLYGQRFLIDNFGKATTVGMNVDPFGHNAMLPAILRGHGLDCYTFLRPSPHEEWALPRTPFWWEAPDGSRVIASRIPNEYCAPPGDLAGTIEKGLGQLALDFNPLMVFYGVGNHGGGPTKANIDSIHRYSRMGTFGRIAMSTPRAYFDEVLARVDTDQLPVWKQDLQHHAAGCYSAHSGIKAWGRRAQWAALKGERWAIAADVLGATVNPALAYPVTDMERAWKQVLFNQFHDILPGSAVEEAYTDARDALGEAVAINQRVWTRAHNAMARQINIPFLEGVQPVVVFNHHPWPVRALVELNYHGQPLGVHVTNAEGTVLPHQKITGTSTTDDKSRGATLFPVELPAFGYKLHYVHSVAQPQESALQASEWVLENDHLRVEIDPETGWLSSLLDKARGIDLVAGASGAHVSVSEDPTDTWGHRVVSYAWPGTDMNPTRILLHEAGPVRASIRVEREWGRSVLVEEFILGLDSDALEVRVTVDWREQAHLLKLRVPLALDDAQATYEIPYAALERPVDGAEEPAQMWVSLSGSRDGRFAGLAVVNDAKHAYDCSPANSPEQGNSPSIGITAVRSPVYAWHDPKLLDESAIYQVHDQGIQTFSYLLVPHSGDWRKGGLTRRAAELATRPRAMLESYHDGVLPSEISLVSASDEVHVTAIKGSEDTASDDRHDLVIRAVEAKGVSGHATIDLPIVGRRITAEFTPYQIRTFLVPRNRRRRVVEVDLVERPLEKQSGFETTSIDPVPTFASGNLTMTKPS